MLNFSKNKFTSQFRLAPFLAFMAAFLFTGFIFYILSVINMYELMPDVLLNNGYLSVLKPYLKYLRYIILSILIIRFMYLVYCFFFKTDIVQIVPSKGYDLLISGPITDSNRTWLKLLRLGFSLLLVGIFWYDWNLVSNLLFNHYIIAFIILLIIAVIYWLFDDNGLNYINSLSVQNTSDVSRTYYANRTNKYYDLYKIIGSIFIIIFLMSPDLALYSWYTKNTFYFVRYSMLVYLFIEITASLYRFIGFLFSMNKYQVVKYPTVNSNKSFNLPDRFK